MDLSQYAELFLAESREHLSACNQLLLEWEKSPANLAPVGPDPLAPSPRSGEGEPGGEVAEVVAGRLVQVTLRGEAPLKGGRALLVIKKAQAIGPVHAVTPPESAFEADEFDGRFSFRIRGAAGTAEIERAVRAAGDVEHVTVGGEERRPGAGAGAAPSAAPETKSRHIRVDLGRLDGLMDLIC